MNLELWLNTWAPRACAAVEFALYTPAGAEASYYGYNPVRLERGFDNRFDVSSGWIQWPMAKAGRLNDTETLRYVGVRFLDVLEVCSHTCSLMLEVPISIKEPGAQPSIRIVADYPVMIRCGPWLGE